jgi:hypothetical protein
MRSDARRLMLSLVALIGGLALLAAGFVIAVEVRSAVAGPDPAPPAAPPNPGHSWSEVEGHGTDGSTYWLGTTGNEALALRTNGAEQVRVTGVGNVGIGTESPNAKLEVSSVMRLAPTDSPGTCDTNLEGGIFYAASYDEPCFCDGLNWKQLDGGGSCITECPDNDEDDYDVCDPGIPNDTDGEPADCDDADATVNPGAPEICDGKDNDCDGSTDEENAVGCTYYYRDLDGDGYGADEKCLCSPSPPYDETQGGDCLDTDPEVYPGAPEYCDDGQDNDCNSLTDCDDPGCAGIPPCP